MLDSLSLMDKSITSLNDVGENDHRNGWDSLPGQWRDGYDAD